MKYRELKLEIDITNDSKMIQEFEPRVGDVASNKIVASFDAELEGLTAQFKFKLSDDTIQQVNATITDGGISELINDEVFAIEGPVVLQVRIHNGDNSFSITDNTDFDFEVAPVL